MSFNEKTLKDNQNIQVYKSFSILHNTGNQFTYALNYVFSLRSKRNQFQLMDYAKAFTQKAVHISFFIKNLESC